MPSLKAIAKLLPASARHRCMDLVVGRPDSLVRSRGARLDVSLDLVLSAYRCTHPDVFFVQVGASDGMLGDPIYPLVKKHSLRGLLIEPLPSSFQKLKANYAEFGGEFIFVNAALAEQDGTKPFYVVKTDAQTPGWEYQLGSFDRSVVMKHSDYIPNLTSLIEVYDMPCITFESLETMYGMERVDLLIIDAEGYDGEILRLFDLPRRKPGIIHFEHLHLSSQEHERHLNALIDQGYQVRVDVCDTLAYLAPGDYFVRQHPLKEPQAAHSSNG